MILNFISIPSLYFQQVQRSCEVKSTIKATIAISLCDKVSDKVSGNTRLTLCIKKKYYSIYHKLVRSDYGTLSFFDTILSSSGRSASLHNVDYLLTTPLRPAGAIYECAAGPAFSA